MKMNTQDAQTYGTVKVVIKCKFIALCAYSEKILERSHISNLAAKLKFVEEITSKKVDSKK